MGVGPRPPPWVFPPYTKDTNRLRIATGSTITGRVIHFRCIENRGETTVGGERSARRPQSSPAMTPGRAPLNNNDGHGARAREWRWSGPQLCNAEDWVQLSPNRGWLLSRAGIGCRCGVECLSVLRRMPVSFLIGGRSTVTTAEIEGDHGGWHDWPARYRSSLTCAVDCLTLPRGLGVTPNSTTKSNPRAGIPPRLPG